MTMQMIGDAKAYEFMDENGMLADLNTIYISGNDSCRGTGIPERPCRAQRRRANKQERQNRRKGRKKGRG